MLPIDVVTPETKTSSKLVWPSTSRVELISTELLKVETPATFKPVEFAVIPDPTIIWGDTNEVPS